MAASDWVMAGATSVQALAVVAGGLWALLEVRRYRQDRVIIQFDIDANLYRLTEPVVASSPTWLRGAAEPTVLAPRKHLYALEVILYLKNRGRTRFRLYNAMVGLNTMRAPEKTQFNKDNGHLHLTRILTSGNIVEKFEVPGKDVADTSFFYIEPGIDQMLTYLALVPEVNELLQIEALFSLDQRRIFPARLKGGSGLYPHNVSRTFQVLDGRLIGRMRAD